MILFGCTKSIRTIEKFIAVFIGRISAHSVHIKTVIHYSNLNVKVRYLNKMY